MDKNERDRSTDNKIARECFANSQSCQSCTIKFSFHGSIFWSQKCCVFFFDNSVNFQNKHWKLSRKKIHIILQHFCISLRSHPLLAAYRTTLKSYNCFKIIYFCCCKFYLAHGCVECTGTVCRGRSGEVGNLVFGRLTNHCIIWG